MGRFGKTFSPAILETTMARRFSNLFRIASMLLLLGPLGVPMPAAAQDVAPAAPPLDPTVQSSSDYRIRQGDEVALTVFGEPTLSPTQPLRVLQGGTIAVPLAGNVMIGGLTTSAASDAVARKLRKYLRDPKVTVAVVAVAPIEALVLGNVKTPGKYTLPPPTRLTDVIAAAGGLGPTDGSFPDARLEYPDGTVATVSLQKLLRDGDVTVNSVVTSGETVYVPSPNLLQVEVIGAVDKPGDTLVREGDDVAMAIARAGTATQEQADLSHVTVSRNGANGGKIVSEVNLYKVLREGDTSHDVVLQKGDVVFVPSSPKREPLAGSLIYTLSNLLHF
jgi:polysaccharide export outer membrane protein